MDFREEYKKSAEIMNPSAESMLRMKQNILEQAKAAPAKKAIPFRKIAIAGGSVAACAVIGISAAHFLPQSEASANDALMSSYVSMESCCEAADSATSATAGSAVSDMILDKSADAEKSINEDAADYDVPAEEANGLIAPEAPAAPMAPEAAEEPAAPDADAATDNADTFPENGGTEKKEPEAPTLPELPAEPEAPEAAEPPSDPVYPDIPILPAYPEGPETPVVPDNPITPEPPIPPEEPEDIVENESDDPLIAFNEDLKICQTDNGTYIFKEILEDGAYPEYDGSLPAEWMHDTTFGSDYFVDYTNDTLFITNAPIDGRVGVYKKAQTNS